MFVISADQSMDTVKNFSNMDDVIQLSRQQEKIAKKNSRTECQDLTQLFICHITKFFPVDGIIHPRVGYEASTIDNSDLNRVKKTVEKAFAIIRPTIHFTVNSIVVSHSNYTTDRKNIIVIDPLSHAVDQLSGGYCEDVFCVGPYRLSKEATILIPESQRKNENLKNQINELSDRIRFDYYSGSPEQAIERWASKNNKKICKPVESNIEVPAFFHTLGNDQYIGSQSLMNATKKIFCTHEITPMSALENYISSSQIFTVKPFLRIILSKENYKEKIKEYISAIKKLYPLSENQKVYLNQYHNTLNLTLDYIKSSENIGKLEETIECFKEFILKYDFKFDLTRPISIKTRTTELLSALTKLDFYSYYRTDCKIVVDAAVHIEEEKIVKTLKELQQQFSFDFVIESHEDKSYIVLKGVNQTEVAESVWKLKNLV